MHLTLQGTAPIVQGPQITGEKTPRPALTRSLKTLYFQPLFAGYVRYLKWSTHGVNSRSE